MERADIAIVTSVVALLLSVVSVAWNIYRELWLRPRFKVIADSLVEVNVGEDGRVRDTPVGKLGISAINLGPGDAKCEVIIARFGSWPKMLLRRSDRAVIARVDSKKLAVGERVNITIAWQSAWFLGEPNVKVGVVDAFGDEHWAPRAQVKRRVREYFSAVADAGNAA